MNTPHSDPQTILRTFEKLRVDHKRLEAQIATKELLATRQKDKELVKLAATYTAENIFQSLAKLQSSFGQSVTELSKAMTIEVDKLAQIQRASQVENQRLETLHNIQIAAETLNILQQEHQKVLQSLEEDYRQKHDGLEKEITKQREVWQRQQQEYEKAKAKQQVLLEKTRHSEEEEYGYSLERQHTEEADGYDKRKRALERELKAEHQKRENNWSERDSYLAKHQTQFDEYKVKVENMPKEIDEAMKKAREEAIKDTYREEETKAKLLEKEMEGKRKAFELKIESLTKTIEQQKVQIVQLTEQLQAASKQAQQLAMTAVTSASAGATKPAEKN